MRSSWLALNIALLLVVGACGGGESQIDVGTGESGRGSAGDDDDDEGGRGSSGRGGRGGSQDSGMTDDGGMPEDGGESGEDAAVDAAVAPPAAPLVTMLLPAAVDDPNEQDIVTSPTVRVRCRVAKSLDPAARDVNQASVVIALVGSADPDQPVVPGSVNALPNNEFEAQFQVADLPNGRLRFACSASDVGVPPLTAMATVETFLDLGPTVTILEPGDGTRHALKEPVLIKFEVKPNPVSDDDAEADVADIHLEVLGIEFVPTEDPAQDGLYTISIDFDDSTLFAMPPSTAQIIVTASNSRTPEAPTRRVDSNIDIDADGPAIVVTFPLNLAIVRGSVPLTVAISDPSGFEPDTLTGVINTNQYYLDDWRQIGSGIYQQQFDTRTDMFDLLTQLTINITADDSVGNRTTVDHVLRLDNVPPLLSLDPPHVREWAFDSTGKTICSEAFDPVGDDAANDLETVLASSLYRVLVFERTNVSSGANYRYHAGVNPYTMRLFARHADAVPLVVDTDEDTYCDSINEVPASGAPPVQITLLPVRTGGGATYLHEPHFNVPEHTASAACQATYLDFIPNKQCRSTQMTRSLPQPLDGAPPALYAFAPSNMSTGPCDGNTWELLSNVGEGWACVAARVEDNIGNVGIAKPIRVCVNDESGAPPSCPLPAPDCNDGCLGPDEFPRNMELMVR